MAVQQHSMGSSVARHNILCLGIKPELIRGLQLSLQREEQLCKHLCSATLFTSLTAHLAFEQN